MPGILSSNRAVGCEIVGFHSVNRHTLLNIAPPRRGLIERPLWVPRPHLDMQLKNRNCVKYAAFLTIGAMRRHSLRAQAPSHSPTYSRGIQGFLASSIICRSSRGVAALHTKGALFRYKAGGFVRIWAIAAVFLFSLGKKGGLEFTSRIRGVQM
jgi:hypothetical protein